jgi:hypothetical protein
MLESSQINRGIVGIYFSRQKNFKPGMARISMAVGEATAIECAHYRVGEIRNGEWVDSPLNLQWGA